MLLIRPEWIQHEDDKGKRTSIFSLSVHPNGNRLATGGLDTKVKIWNTEPVLRKDAEADLGVPKLLAAMGLHNGTVLCLAWSNGEGRYLASGSDDNIVLIWELDTNAADGFGGSYGNLSGLGNSNVENWKAVKRLVGHESDVTDVAWAPENQYLATCGLDNFVFIWDGTNFERLKKLDCHQGFVKGLTWDPIGKYLASQSDDKTLNVYKCLDDWKLETRVKQPFENSNNVTLYRRPSWSPDGSFIAAANAAERSIQIAAIVSRDKWKSEISLVGHAAAIETVRFNPVLFKPSDSDESALTEDQSRQQYTSICAVGSQDRSISVWTTRDQRPLSVAEGFFEHNVLDLDWSPDGLTLYGCSYDGSIVALSFEEAEFGCAISMDEKVQLMSKHGYKQKEVVLAESPTQLRLEEEYRLASKQAANQRFTLPATVPEPMPMVPERLLPISAASSESPASGPLAPTTPTKSTGPAPSLIGVPATPAAQKVTITKDGKKRIQPQFIRTLTGGPTSSPTPAKLPPSRMAMASSSLLATSGPASGAQTPFTWAHGPPSYAAPTSTMEMDQPSRTLPVAVPLETAATGNKRKPAINGHTEGTAAKRSARGSSNGGSSNGRDRLQDSDNDQSAPPLQRRSVLNSQAFAHAQIRLSVPKVQTRLTKSFQQDHQTLTWNATNDFEHKKPAQVIQKSQGTVAWTTFVSSHVLLITGNDLMVMVACEDGSLHVFTHAGRRVFPALVLEAPASFLDCNGFHFLCLTSVGLLYIWDLHSQEVVVAGVSVGPVLDLAMTPATQLQPTVTISSAHLRPGGTAVLTTSSGQAFMYHQAMKVWMKVVDRWYSSSDFFLSYAPPPPTVSFAQATGVLSAIQGATTRLAEFHLQLGPQTAADHSATSQYSPQQLMTMFRKLDSRQRKVVTMDHLEHQVITSQFLQSPNEFRYWLNCYARRLADDNAQDRIEELCNWLLGPVDAMQDMSDDSVPPIAAKPQWDSTVLGFHKRALLAELLRIFATNRQLQRLIKQYSQSLEVQETPTES